jgi:hypothetical protein
MDITILSDHPTVGEEILAEFRVSYRARADNRKDGTLKKDRTR